MTVKIVTDSGCDLPESVLEEYGITMVPVDVIHEGKVYKDRVDISHDELFEMLEREPTVPTSAAPPPGYFTAAYERLAEETDEIVSLHLTSQHSAVYDSARKGSENVKRKCRIEVVDTQSISMGLGLLAMDAAEAANSGLSLDGVVELVKRIMPRIRLFGAFDTMRYLTLGGRISKVIGNLGTTLRVRPLLTVNEGRISLAGVARTYKQAVERLVAFNEKLGEIEKWSVVYSTGRDVAEAVAERLSRLCPPGKVPIARLGPALGVHGGPGTIITAAKLRVRSVADQAHNILHRRLPL